MPRRLSQLLLLALCLAALTWAAQAQAGMPAPAALTLLLAGVMAQGFASYQAPGPQFIELRRRPWAARALGWAFRALIGASLLAGLLMAAFWLLRKI
ncbi:hypothetical protein HNQ51_000731 [Inhella inkyongensis]|uniref:Uncharacterized protein n=2 Tax=Inhella inkyongensis TaxID=392593 RepID=A0A840S1Z3_9BURK|nr:hypothetical protein [Inhella inkyongensis]MBB5203438.1 hypothetical protein [Inhella inkyongensis]